MSCAKHLEDAALPLPPKTVAAARALRRRAMVPFRLPSLASDMDFGTLLHWQVAPGGRLRRGQVLARVQRGT